MNAVWSLWTLPMREGSARGGWPNLRDHMLSWALSVGSARRYFPQTRLVTDTPGARLLVDQMQLPFDTVSTALDALDGSDPELWAMGKIAAYRAQPEPFVHIDSDVYLWQQLPDALLTADVLAAYPEYRPYGRSEYRCASLRHTIRNVRGWMPQELDEHVPVRGQVRAENCALMGGTRLDFIHHYADAALRMASDRRNQIAWRRRGPMASDTMVFEQHLLSACLVHHGGRPGSPFADVTIRYLFDSEADAFEHAGSRGFTHLISRSKDDMTLLRRLAARVEADYPEAYARCMALDG